MNRIYISARADRALIEYLADSGYEVYMLPRSPGPDPAIADHPDLVFCSLGLIAADACHVRHVAAGPLVDGVSGDAQAVMG
ncbi:MAG: hypothetical protein IKT31_11440, partial [Firmicutes bacterium]|nr:hypothetical protein [Bacillota bacterium]